MHSRATYCEQLAQREVLRYGYLNFIAYTANGGIGVAV
jgi:hypothetical protein